MTDINPDISSHVETVVMLSHKKTDSVINVKVKFGEGEGKVPLDHIAKRGDIFLSGMPFRTKDHLRQSYLNMQQVWAGK